jgi:hydroxyacylglutathione hydrolase
MRVTRIVTGPLETNCWVVSDDANGPAVIIDPAGEAERILAEVGERDVRAVVLTHGHFDHLGAVADLLGATGAPLMVHRLDADSITTSTGNGGALFGFSEVAPSADCVLEDGETIAAGGVEMVVLHTPGHTPGGVCLFARQGEDETPQLCSGDTVCAGSVGRTDFAGGDPRALSRSIAEKIAPLPPETVVHPGHGPDSTVGRELRLNPFFPRA